MSIALLVVLGMASSAVAAVPGQSPSAPAWYLDDGLKKLPADLKDDDLKALHARLSALLPEQQMRDSAESFGAKQARLLGEKLVGNKGFDDVWVTTVDPVTLGYDPTTERATLAIRFADAAPADGTSTSGLVHVVDKIETDLVKADAKGGKSKFAATGKRKVLEQSILFMSRSRTLWVRTDEANRRIMAELLVKKNAIDALKGRVAAKLVFKPLPLPVREVEETALPSSENLVEVQTRNAVMAAELLAVVFYDRTSSDVLVLLK